MTEQPKDGGPAFGPLTVRYTNWRGETGVRRILPRQVWWGRTEWHPEPQWMMTAYDIDKQDDRDFALSDMDIAAAREVPHD